MKYSLSGIRSCLFNEGKMELNKHKFGLLKCFWGNDFGNIN